MFSGSGLIQSNRTHKFAFYTGVTRLPLHWTLPYFSGAETQNMLMSRDGGVTWRKYARNPLIPRPPSLWNVTGFRDPYVFQDPYIDDLLRHEYGCAIAQPCYYMLLGSGMKDYGGAVPMYISIDMIDWTPLPLPLFMHSSQSSTDNWILPDGYHHFSLGYNYEVPNLLPLATTHTAQHQQLYALVFGTEGNAPHLRGHHMAVYLIGTLRLRHTTTDTQTHLVKPLRSGSYIEFVPLSLGLMDHGMAYAFNVIVNAPLSHQHPLQARRHALMTWINEDWEVEDLQREQTAGAMGLPREVYLYFDHHQNGHTKVPRLGIRPVEQVVKLRNGAKWKQFHHVISSSSRSFISNPHVDDHTDDNASHRGPYIPPPLLPPSHSNNSNTSVPVAYFPLWNVTSPTRYEIRLTVRLRTRMGRMRSEDEAEKSGVVVGLVLHHAAPFRHFPHHLNTEEAQAAWKEYTVVYLSPFQQSLTVSRWKSSPLRPSANNESVVMKLTWPFHNRTMTTSSSVKGKEEVEEVWQDVDLRVFLDHSLLEVFVNDRYALSTRVYPSFYQPPHHHSYENKKQKETFIGVIMTNPVLTGNGSSGSDVARKWDVDVMGTQVWFDQVPIYPDSHYGADHLLTDEETSWVENMSGVTLNGALDWRILPLVGMVIVVVVLIGAGLVGGVKWRGRGRDGVYKRVLQ